MYYFPGDKIRKLGSNRVYEVVMSYDCGDDEGVTTGLLDYVMARDAAGNLRRINADVIVGEHSQPARRRRPNF